MMAKNNNRYSPWEIVQLSRHPDRPVLEDFISVMFSEFLELHGDRCFSDDRSMIGGFAMLDQKRVMLIGHNKGKTIEDNIERNFGMSNPEGYRKTLRLMKLAEKFSLPVISFINTAGAYPGMDAEERGQAEAIAKNLLEMSRLKVPIVAIVTGEGGSGGALGIGVADVVLMMNNSIYSVITPEGCAAILWRDQQYAPQAAEALKLTASSLLKLGVVDEVVKEPRKGAHANYKATFKEVKQVLLKHLDTLEEYSTTDLVNRRFEKLSTIGNFNEQIGI